MKVALTDDLDTCRALRRTVFIDEQGVTEAEEWDGRDGDALHVLGWLGDTPVGTARVFIEGDTAKIGRVCVLAAAREAGAAIRLTQAFSPWEMMDADTEKALSELEKIMAFPKP